MDSYGVMTIKRLMTDVVRLVLTANISKAIVTPHDKTPKLPMSNADIDQIIANINSLRLAG